MFALASQTLSRSNGMPRNEDAAPREQGARLRDRV